MSANWRTAFFTQARSDYHVLLRLMETPGTERCHVLHYLQMTTEKLAKGFSTDGNTQPPVQHLGFVRFLQTAKNQHSQLRRVFQAKNPRHFSDYLNGLLPIAREIEQLAPRGTGQTPNPEYPWKTPVDNVIVAPCEHDFSFLEPRNPKMSRLLGFLDRRVRYTEVES